MDKGYGSFLNKYIPSADMRAKIIEVGHQFSDWDRAAIIWNSDFPLYEKHEEIQRIAEGTSDGVLKEQILERIAYDHDPKEREIKVNTLSNKRFENKFVVFPKIFEENEKIRVVGMDTKSNGFTGWVNRGLWEYEEFIKKATGPKSIEDYSDAALPIDYWAEDRLTWDHSHILPIYLERISEELCNSFDEDNQIIIGHDYGGAVWIQVVKVNASDKILSKDIKEVGKEISVNKPFFDRVLKPLFVEAFDPNMTENKNRYTYAFSEEGRYLTCFEEDILENNFFTYKQIEKILDIIEDCVRDGVKRIGERIEGKDAIQLVTFAAHMRRIMAENPDLKLISVLS